MMLETPSPPITFDHQFAFEASEISLPKNERLPSSPVQMIYSTSVNQTYKYWNPVTIDETQVLFKSAINHDIGK